MNKQLKIEPLTAEAFAPFGDVLDTAGAPDKIINNGMCHRYHDRAQMDFGADVGGGRAGLNLFDAIPRELPYEFDLLERHPLGSQAFVPMSYQPFLVIVAPDEGGKPGQPRAFETTSGQAINFHRGTWHGVLTPLHGPGLFAVVDRIGAGDNLEEVSFEAPFVVTR